MELLSKEEVDPMERETEATQDTHPPATAGGFLSWGSIFAGLIVGYVSLLILVALGLALWLATLAAAGPRTFGGLAIGAYVWFFVALALAAYLAGRTTV